jgi:hypothetical protein
VRGQEVPEGGCERGVERGCGDGEHAQVEDGASEAEVGGAAGDAEQARRRALRCNAVAAVGVHSVGVEKVAAPVARLGVSGHGVGLSKFVGLRAVSKSSEHVTCGGVRCCGSIVDCVGAHCGRCGCECLGLL